MDHWSDRYVGQPYVPDVATCAHLAARVQREIYGRSITLPQLQGHAHTDHAAAIAQHLPDYGVPTTSPEEGDAVLLIGRGYSSHIGVYVCLDGEPWVLHSLALGSQVSRHRLRTMARIGLKVEGFYKWK